MDQRTPDEIRHDIEKTREQMGDTVEALAAKADVKGQARAKVTELRENVTQKKEELSASASQAAPDSAGQAAEQAKTFARGNPTAVAAAVGVVAGFVLGRLLSGSGSGSG
jgi:ElaB/YqjD/DUF883 family membrane-anchored ribosome-binding protein